MMRRPFVQQSPMPGFGLAMGITMTMLSVVVLLPIPMGNMLPAFSISLLALRLVAGILVDDAIVVV